MKNFVEDLKAKLALGEKLAPDASLDAELAFQEASKAARSLRDGAGNIGAEPRPRIPAPKPQGEPT